MDIEKWEKLILSSIEIEDKDSRTTTKSSEWSVNPYNEDDLEDNRVEDEWMGRQDRQFESFAKEAMRELVNAGLADFVLLKNDKLRKWWSSVVKKELEEQIKREAIENKRKLKEQALSKLSDEEKEALGLTKKKR